MGSPRTSRVNWRASPLHAAIVGMANSAVQLASAFGVHLTSAQDVAITTGTNAALVLVSVVVITATNGSSAAKAAG